MFALRTLVPNVALALEGLPDADDAIGGVSLPALVTLILEENCDCSFGQGATEQIVWTCELSANMENLLKIFWVHGQP